MIPVGPTLFGLLAWATLCTVLVIFGYLWYSIVRAGGIDLDCGANE